MKKILWVLSLISSLFGVVVIFIGISGAKGAPQEAVFIALGIAFAVIPYCISRAYSEMRS